MRKPTEKMPYRLTDRVLNVVSDDKGLTFRQICIRCGTLASKRRNLLRGSLVYLMGKGKVEVINSSNPYLYRLTQQDTN